MKNVFFFLVTHFSIGLLFTILFISMDEIGKLYFRVTTLIASTLIVVGLLSQPFGNFEFMTMLSNPGFSAETLKQLTYFCFGAVVMLLLLYNGIRLRFHKPLLALSFILGVLGVAAYSATVSSGEQTSGRLIALFIANGVGSALILGSVLGAMITGHWYLVHHKLGLTPLKNSSVIYIAAVFLRVVLIGLGILFFLSTQQGAVLAESLRKLNFSGFIFLGRIIFGLVLPFVFGIMVWKSAVIRSTQSATGILYATIVLVLIGETFGKFLYMLIGIPL